MNGFSVVPVPGMPMVEAGDDLTAQILQVLASNGLYLVDGDVVCIAQKVISKAEGQLVPLADITPSAEAIALAEETDASSVHVTFTNEADFHALTSVGYLARHDTQFHWLNRGYDTPDDFLAALASRKRKQVKRERRDALANGITIEWVTGADITEAHWDAFYEFYMDTGSRKWGRPYLNRTFFSLLGERLADSVCLVFAVREGRYIAGALNLIGSDLLVQRMQFHHATLSYSIDVEAHTDPVYRRDVVQYIVAE